jgi:hypothetical protein
MEIANLYKEIADMRKSYQEELKLKDRHIHNLEEKM